MKSRCLSTALLVTGTALAILLAGCKRPPEDVEPTSTTTVPAQPTVRIVRSALPPPQTSSTVGITFTSLPDGLIITSNDDLWIEVTDVVRPQVYYTLVALPPDAAGISLADVGTFEDFLPSFTDRKARSEGTVKTRFGQARWASGVYSEDESEEDGETEELTNVRIVAPHPSGDGFLAIHATFTPGVCSVDESLAIMQDLLNHVS